MFLYNFIYNSFILWIFGFFNVDTKCSYLPIIAQTTSLHIANSLDLHIHILPLPLLWLKWILISPTGGICVCQN